MPLQRPLVSRFATLMPLVVATMTACATASAPAAPMAPKGREEPTQPEAKPAEVADPTLNAERAERALRSLLALLRATSTVASLTPEQIEGSFGLALERNGTSAGTSAPMGSRWGLIVLLEQKGTYGPRLEVSFHPMGKADNPPATDICRMDYDAFAHELATLGFSHETYRGEHGRILHESFARGGLTLVVETRGEAEAPPEKIRHACVTRVLAS